MSGWDDVVGHARVVKTLQRAVASENPHGAWLMLGPRGVGKMTVARTFAQALLCQGRDKPCGSCPPCAREAVGTHADLLTLEPTGKSRTIGVDQVSEVQRMLGFRRFEGGHRVVLFDDAGTLNEQAQNKLLKTLEEPPAGTVLVLCALHPSQLLITVRSRCQKVVLAPLDRQELADWLVTARDADPQAAAIAAAAGGGLPGRAVELLDPERAQVIKARQDHVLAALSGDREATAALIEAVDRDREGCMELLALLQEVLRDAMVATSGAAVPRLHPAAAPEEGKLGALPPRVLAELLGSVEATRARLARNVHPGGLLDELLRRIRTVAA